MSNVPRSHIVILSLAILAALPSLGALWVLVAASAGSLIRRLAPTARAATISFFLPWPMLGR